MKKESKEAYRLSRMKKTLTVIEIKITG